MRLITKAFLALSLCCGPAAFAAGTFDYKINGYPKDAGDCHALAATLGAQFAQAAGVTVTRSICAQIRDEGYDIVITYSAAVALDPVSTLDLRGSVDARGAYATDAECRTALALETQRFTAATGLTPFISYCFDDVYTDDFPYALRIEAFGVPAHRPYVETRTFFGSPVDLPLADVEQITFASLQTRGVDVSYVRYHDEVGMGNIQILYYADQPMKLVLPDFGRLTDGDQCKTELAALASALTPRADHPLVSFCGSDTVLGEYLLNTAFLGQPALIIEAAAETYTSYDACVADRAAAVARYQALGRRAIGGICGENAMLEAQWKLVLLEDASR